MYLSPPKCFLHVSFQPVKEKLSLLLCGLLNLIFLIFQLNGCWINIRAFATNRSANFLYWYIPQYSIKLQTFLNIDELFD